MTIQRKTAVLFGACVIAGNILATSAQAHEVAAESPVAGYKMAAVIDRARGNVVLAGNYAEAIEALDTNGREHFASKTNLCVAYTMTGDLEKADAECDAALKLSEGKAVRNHIAVALSNLGVVKAVSGDLNGAQQNFNRALEFNRKLSEASDNLRVLREAHASDA
jgi:tetratricopeptide (TPR) repeat protein